MPGIVGIVAPHVSPKEKAELERMVRVIRHEPSYLSGSFFEESLGVGLGWTAHSGSFSDCVPSWNERRDVCLLFAGEEFSDPAVLSELRRKGHEFEEANASYLVHLYEESGVDFLEKLNGCFGGVLIDLRRREAVLFNDRYGLSRIYYSEVEGVFYFASEAKALLAVLPNTRQLDSRGMGELLACGCVLQNRTIFSRISVLPGGAKWSFVPRSPPKREAYFSKGEWEEATPLGPDEFYEELKSTFRRVLPKYFGGKSPIGMSLTGGLDGRMIMAWANQGPGSLPCYTFGSRYRDCTDVTIARAVAQAAGQPHRVIPVGADFHQHFGVLAEKSLYYSDGMMDVTGAVELYVNGIARQIAPVRLTGNYGSEVLRGNVAFKPRALSPELYGSDYLASGETAAATYRQERADRLISFIAFKQVPWHHTSRLSVERTQLTMRSPFLDNELVRLMYRAPADLAVSAQPALRLVADGNRKMSAIPTDRGLLFRPRPLVTKAWNTYNEFTFKAEYAYDYGMPQSLARVDHYLRAFHLERVFLGRHKFHHFRIWYRDELSRCVKDMLLDSQAQSRPMFRRGALEKLVSDHLRGRRNYTSEIHQAFTCELIHRQLIERNWSET
jgi:asparagine synthase (glutamine-hydrolysing)